MVVETEQEGPDNASGHCLEVKWVCWAGLKDLKVPFQGYAHCILLDNLQFASHQNQRIRLKPSRSCSGFRYLPSIPKYSSR